MSDRSQIYQYKGNRCAACGLSVADMITRFGTFNRMFHFHHVDPTSKDRSYKRLMAQRLSRKQMDEIDKCVLLCVQCHATIHAQEIRATLVVSVQIDGRVVSQEVGGWIKADHTDKKLTFITNEVYLLHPCEVRFDAGTSVRLCANEVAGRLISWIDEIGRLRTVEVFSLRDRRTVLTLRHVEGCRIAVEQSISFPLMPMEFHSRDVVGEVVYLRNGFALMASGAIYSKGVVSYVLASNRRNQLADA